MNRGIPLRIARHSRDLAAARQFWVDGVGLSVLFHAERPGEPALLMLGWPDADWHLELVAAVTEPRPAEEDLLVLYLGEPVSAEWTARLESSGGRRVPASSSYWDQWGVTFADPDGYRLVLSQRNWDNSP